MRVLQISDLHQFAAADAVLKGVAPRDSLRRVVRDLASETARSELLVVTGDLTHDECEESYRAVRELLTDWSDRLRIVPGNHDDRARLAATFPPREVAVPGRLTWSESRSGWRLVGLDSHVPGALGGLLGPEQLAWFDDLLGRERQQPVAVFLHHPPLPVGSRWLDDIALADAASFWEIAERHPALRLVACGHVHQEFVAIHGAATVLTTPSTSVQFRPETETLEKDDAPPGYRILDLHADGTWTSRVQRSWTGAETTGRP